MYLVFFYVLVLFYVLFFRSAILLSSGRVWGGQEEIHSPGPEEVERQVDENEMKNVLNEEQRRRMLLTGISSVQTSLIMGTINASAPLTCSTTIGQAVLGVLLYFISK